MTTREKNYNGDLPSVDFNAQSDLSVEKRKIERNIFDILKSIASNVAVDPAKSMGAIVVFGDFIQPHHKGLIQMKPKQNPITFSVMINTDKGVDTLETFSRHPYDGAVVVNKDGQIVGAGMYLVVEHPTIDVPDGCGTRHKSAASFSLHNDIISVLTLSEETNTVRLWRDGKVEEVLEVKGELK
jgi:DNA integrity scanning protein DisA with diadenylate cyclase activity